MKVTAWIQALRNTPNARSIKHLLELTQSSPHPPNGAVSWSEHIDGVVTTAEQACQQAAVKADPKTVQCMQAIGCLPLEVFVDSSNNMVHNFEVPLVLALSATFASSMTPELAPWSNSLLRCCLQRLQAWLVVLVEQAPQAMRNTLHLLANNSAIVWQCTMRFLPHLHENYDLLHALYIAQYDLHHALDFEFSSTPPDHALLHSTFSLLHSGFHPHTPAIMFPAFLKLVSSSEPLTKNQTEDGTTHTNPMLALATFGYQFSLAYALSHDAVERSALLQSEVEPITHYMQPNDEPGFKELVHLKSPVLWIYTRAFRYAMQHGRVRNRSMDAETAFALPFQAGPHGILLNTLKNMRSALSSVVLQLLARSAHIKPEHLGTFNAGAKGIVTRMECMMDEDYTPAFGVSSAHSLQAAYEALLASELLDLQQHMLEKVGAVLECRAVDTAVIEKGRVVLDFWKRLFQWLEGVESSRCECFPAA